MGISGEISYKNDDAMSPKFFFPSHNIAHVLSQRYTMAL